MAACPMRDCARGKAEDDREKARIDRGRARRYSRQGIKEDRQTYAWCIG